MVQRSGADTCLPEMRVGHMAGPRMRLGQTKIAWMASIVRASLRENERIRCVVTEQIARGESVNFLSCKWLGYLERMWAYLQRMWV